MSQQSIVHLELRSFEAGQTNQSSVIGPMTIALVYSCLLVDDYRDHEEVLFCSRGCKRTVRP